jgi:hypothetical protein
MAHLREAVLDEYRAMVEWWLLEEKRINSESNHLQCHSTFYGHCELFGRAVQVMLLTSTEEAKGKKNKKGQWEKREDEETKNSY